MNPCSQHSRWFVVPLLVAALLMAPLLSSSVWADPCGMVPPVMLTQGNPELTRVGDQITYVFFSEGIEDIVLRPAFEGSVAEFGMLIPFPAVPEIRKVQDEIFTHLAKAVDPPEIVINLEERYLIRASESKARDLGRLEFRRDQVQVVKEEAVGMYQVAVLKAEDPRALQEWMTTHGYVYPEGMDDVCRDYIESDWCFVAVKANVGSQQAVEPRPGMRESDPSLPSGSSFAGAVQAMGFRFRIDAPVVPMRLSAFNPGELHNIVYLLTDEPCRIEQLPTGLVKRQVSGEQLFKNLTDPLPVRVVGSTLERLRKNGGLKRYDRNPVPHNGYAQQLFAADLLAARANRLSHPFEEREKDLLRIGERLGLRGPEVDQRIQNQLQEELARGTEGVLEDLKRLTLTVLEGDFPRDIIARENLTFVTYEFAGDPKSEQGRHELQAKRVLVGFLPGAIILLAIVGLLGTAVFRRRSPALRNCLLLVLVVGLAFSSGPALAFESSASPPPSHLDFGPLFERLSDADQAEITTACLIALGETVVPRLIEEATEAADLSRRGWAIVCLSDIGSKRALDPLRALMRDPGSPELVKLWSGAAVTRLQGREGIRDLVVSQANGSAQAAEVAPVILGLRGAAVRPLVELTLESESVEVRRLATSYLGALDGRVGGGVVRAVLSEGLRYTPEKSEAGVPWDGGPLFLPGYAWTQDEAWNTTLDLVSWMVWAEQQERGDVVAPLVNNLRDLSWRNGVGFQQLPKAHAWVQLLATKRGGHSRAVTESTAPETLFLILELLRRP